MFQTLYNTDIFMSTPYTTKLKIHDLIYVKYYLFICKVSPGTENIKLSLKYDLNIFRINFEIRRQP